ncbi:hypothetical protein ACFXKY_35240 [Streptomyces canus]|uniref:hypothetical protein n=1 Tax=Streptomyces canus TaxID=58343 RepID=UPI0036C29572
MRSNLGTITDVVRSVVAPAALIANQAETAIVEASNPAGLDEVDEIPQSSRLRPPPASTSAPPTRPATPTVASAPCKGPRKASLRHLRHIFRTPSSRQAPNLAEITRILKAHGLAPSR